MQPSGIVLIEDHALIRDLLDAMAATDRRIELAGRFATADDGLKGCLRLRPALVILDWELPDGSGAEVIRALAAKLPGAAVLVLTAHERRYVVLDAIDAGARGVVMKRSGYPVLVDAVRAVLAGGTYYCPAATHLLEQPEPLNPQERRLVCAVARSEPVKSLAGRLGLDEKTVYAQLAAVKKKLRIDDAAGLARYAIQHGLIASAAPPGKTPARP